MKTEAVVSNGQGVVSIVLALVAALLIGGVLTNRNVPLITNSRGAFIALIVVGFIMCAVGGLSGKVERVGFSWLSPFVILGILLGVSAGYVAFAGLTGRNLPFVSGERGAFIWLSGIIIAKWLLSRIHTLQLG